MSRIIVKGLPVYLTDDNLKQHFIKRLNVKHSVTVSLDLITDLKILRDKSGKSRRFAFVGFRDESDAIDAIKYFNDSFIDTSKIEVSLAKSFADPNVPKPMKEKRREALKRLREREEALLDEKNKKKAHTEVSSKQKSIDMEIEKNNQLKEFIETMRPSSQVASWEKVTTSTDVLPKTNDSDGDDDDSKQDDSASANPLLAQALALKDDSDDEYMDLNNRETNAKETTNEHTEDKMMSLDNFESSAIEPAEQDNIAQISEISDLDWFKQRRVRIREGENTPVNDNVKETANEVSEVEPQTEDIEQAQKVKLTSEEIAIQKIKETGRLFLRNILYTSTENDFKTLFSKFGELEEVHIALDTRTGQSKGFAYVQFKNNDEAVEAYIELDKQIFQGRLLHIIPAESKKSHRLDEFDLKNMPLKKQKELKRKDNASKQTFSWNSLYMSQDAVLSSVATKLGVEKSQLIDPENSNSAVKQALAEAHVIGDVRTYFESKGVDLTKFAELRANNKKDDHVILVKNFPFGTTREDLGELFLPFGKLERLLMPPAGTIAVLQYRDLTSARSAFSKLAYKRFKNSILYLERGPMGLFVKDAEKSDSVVDNALPTETVKEIKPSASDIMDSSITEKTNDNENVFDGPTVSIFIKNLNFLTTSIQLNKTFEKFPGFIVAQVKTKSDPKNKDKTLSMGFGFVEYKTKEQALAVISAIDGTVIDGHRVQLKLSHRQGNSGNNNNGKTKGKPSSKIIVKNLPFEATRKDIFELFNSFGQLKSVRVPKKFDKSARGFAFVEFLLPKEAENAMDQLQGVHLLGRRLVMQHAQGDAVDAEEEISRMTEKVKKQMDAREYGALRAVGGRRKLHMDDEDDGLNGV